MPARSVLLPPDARQAGPVDILRGGGEHLAVHSQVLQALELASAGPHGLSGIALAHAGRLVPALGVVDSAGAIVAAAPAVLDGGVVAELD